MPRTGTTCFDGTIRSGLPVYVTATIYPSEPDVGIFQPQIEITGVYWPQRFSRRTRRALPLRAVPNHLISSADLKLLETQALESAE